MKSFYDDGRGIKIYNADCRDILPNLDKVDALLADPPYGHSVVKESWDDITDYWDFTCSWLPLVRFSEHGQALVFCSIGKKSESLIVVADYMKQAMNFQDMIVWKKQRGRGNVKGYLFVREQILWATVSENYYWNREAQYSTDSYHESWIKRLKKEAQPFKRLTNVFTDIEEVSIELARTSGGRGARKSYHPTQKPVALIRRLICSHTKPDDTILDPFMGSGTTLVAARLEGRKAVGIEISEQYCEIAVKRLELETAQ